ncbi:TPA: hypothetical protein ACH3X2_004257 [Trebouxia sp. C0005]
MEATLSFNACHVRRTLGVQHSVRRLTSYRHELQQGAKCRPRRSYATVCSSSLGHAYSITDSTGTIPQQQGQQPDAAGVDISLLAEKLQGQWHEKLNRHLGHVLIKPCSNNRKVWWSCDQCPDGFPHIW